MSMTQPIETPIDLTPELYVAVVVRHDGPVPGLCSAQQLGFAIAGIDEHGAWKQLTDVPTMVLSLKPVGQAWKSSGSTAASDRDRLASEGEDVGYAITRAANWINNHAATLGYQPGSTRIVAVTWPGTFDAGYVLHYFDRHNGVANPFAQSGRRSPEELFSLTAEARRRLTAPAPLRTPARVARPVDALGR